MQDRCRRWVWMAGISLVAGVLATGGMRAAGQTPADNDTPPQNPTGQNAVMQKRPPNPLTQDSDPVPSPDPQNAVPGQAQKPVLGQTEGQGQADEITKENGRFTLRTNAFEVRLNASVLDSSDHVVDSLPELSLIHI